MFEGVFDMVYKNDKATEQKILTKLYINKTKQEFSIELLAPNQTHKVTQCVLCVPEGCVPYEYCCDGCDRVVSFPHLFIFQHHIPPNTDYCLNCVKRIDDEERERLKSRSLRELFLRGLKPLLTFVTAHHGCLLEPTIENFRLCRSSQEEETVDRATSIDVDESTVLSQTDEGTSSSCSSSSSCTSSSSSSSSSSSGRSSSSSGRSSSCSSSGSSSGRSSPDVQESDTTSESEVSSNSIDEEGSEEDGDSMFLYNYESPQGVYSGLGAYLELDTSKTYEHFLYSLHYQ